MQLAQVADIAEGFANVKVAKRWNHKTWVVNDRGFLWERPFSKADLKRFAAANQTPPHGDIIALTTADLDAKDALLSLELPGFFTIEHFNHFPAVLVELRLARVRDVKAAIRSAYQAVVAKPPPKPRRKPSR